jgi:hypothetical protein
MPAGKALNGALFAPFNQRLGRRDTTLVQRILERFQTLFLV